MTEAGGKLGKIILTIVLIVAAIGMYFYTRPKSPQILSEAYFIDEDNNTESTRSLADIPPLKNSSGKDSIVREFKYTCDDGGPVKVAYYIKFTPEMKAKLETFKTQQERDSIDPTGGTLVRSPDAGSKWVAFASTEGKRVTTVECPEGHNVSAVFP